MVLLTVFFAQSILALQEGKVEQVSYGTPMGRESKDFYKQIELVPMPYGQALASLFFMEALKLCK